MTKKQQHAIELIQKLKNEVLEEETKQGKTKLKACYIVYVLNQLTDLIYNNK